MLAASVAVVTGSTIVVVVDQGVIVLPDGPKLIVA